MGLHGDRVLILEEGGYSCIPASRDTWIATSELTVVIVSQLQQNLIAVDRRIDSEDLSTGSCRNNKS